MTRGSLPRPPASRCAAALVAKAPSSRPPTRAGRGCPARSPQRFPVLVGDGLRRFRVAAYRPAEWLQERGRIALVGNDLDDGRATIGDHALRPGTLDFTHVLEGPRLEAGLRHRASCHLTTRLPQPMELESHYHGHNRGGRPRRCQSSLEQLDEVVLPAAPRPHVLEICRELRAGALKLVVVFIPARGLGILTTLVCFVPAPWVVRPRKRRRDRRARAPRPHRAPLWS